MTTDDPDPLDDLLSQWQVQVETPPDFRREVWRKVAAETREPSWIERVAWWLLRPKREALILAAVIILAIAWGLTHPPEEISPHDAYVMSISPFDPNHLRGR
ncbi:hypothetical protein [Prosthecobacter sp.]|jgi:hypothetical protein|uniref:hypothetical protein n=1 Tax=Prosthecobacter sp. TaxID=1965333 RepID=UPI0037836380